MRGGLAFGNGAHGLTKPSAVVGEWTTAMGQIEDRMRQLFELSRGPVEPTAWGVRMRRRFDYFTPDEYYEEIVEGLVDSETEWLDVGGGKAVFPGNHALSSMLVQRCQHLTVVDPSPNIEKNTFAHARFQGFLEDLPGENRFTLATARMVVEHVARPELFVARLGGLMRPGGKVVIYTVSRWSPITVLSGCTPIAVHHVAKKILWNVGEEGTFPVEYRMNTRGRLNALFAAAGFRNVAFHRLDDCRALARWRITLAAELSLRALLRKVGIPYPEACLIGVYERI
jgi:SAM-dependent methyltransferase